MNLEVSRLHYCCQCGHEIPRREKFCSHCGTQIEYLCALPPVPAEPHLRRSVNSAASLTKWIILYIVAVGLAFGLSYTYYSSPTIQAWFNRTSSPAAQAPTKVQSKPASVTAAPTATVKATYNQLSIGLQKATVLLEDAKKVNIPGEPLRTAANYRAIQRKCDALLGELAVPPDATAEAGPVLIPLKETISLLGKSTTIMADYLEGKLSLAPPNPDWVGRSQEYSAQAQARLRETQQALGALRKKIE